MTPRGLAIDIDQTARGAYRPTKQRRERLVELLDEQQGEANVRQLAGHLGVSVATVRRDLTALASDGWIARTYGGVIRRGNLDRSWRVKSAENLRPKQAIARHAARGVAADATVVLDAGTTVAEAAALLGERTDVQLVTNGLSSLLALADASAEVIVLGGRLRRPSESIVGGATLQSLERLTADIAFVGAEMVDPRRGINCPEQDQAAAKELMLRNSRSPWVLADASKLDRPQAFPYWCRAFRGCGLLTDSGATEEQLAPFREAGWHVVVADPQ